MDREPVVMLDDVVMLKECRITVKDAVFADVVECERETDAVGSSGHVIEGSLSDRGNATVTSMTAEGDAKRSCCLVSQWRFQRLQ